MHKSGKSFFKKKNYFQKRKGGAAGRLTTFGSEEKCVWNL